MVRIYMDASGTGEFVIQTTCLDPDSFMTELAEAMDAAVVKNNDSGLTALGKLSGYKAENVQEQRTLVCGKMSPHSCEVVASAGR